jgi:hypothetical protein
MSDVDFEDRNTSILCYDGLCDSCEDDDCQHRCHFKDRRWKRKLESVFLCIGIACIPVAHVAWLVDNWPLKMLAFAAIGVVTGFVSSWFEQDWEDES